MIRVSARFVRVLLLGAIVAAGTSAVRAAEHRVVIRDNAFQPADTSVEVGDTVTWVNRDTAVHTTTAAEGWDSGDLAADEQFSFTFTVAGRFEYLCERHPGMRGVVVVGARPSPTPVASQVPNNAVAPPARTGRQVVVVGLLLVSVATAAVLLSGWRRARTSP